MSPAAARWKQPTLLVLMLLAFALRVWRLHAQSLRGDEAFDVVFAQRAVGEIVDELRTTQPYPPAYHLFFKGWMAAVGRSEFALRFPSAWCGALMVPLLYALARFWFHERVALWAALLMALQPLAIWYAQDGRMYAPLMVLMLASTCFAARLWRCEGTWRLWVGYVGVTYLGVMVHYMALLVLAAQSVCAAFVAWRDRDRRFLLRWLAAQTAMGLLYLPWAIFAWPLLRSHASSWAEATSLPAMLWRVLRAYTVGLTLDPVWAVAPVLASCVAMVVASAALVRRREQRVLVPLLVLIALPVAAIAVGSLRRPMFDERYLVFLIAPMMLLLAYGLVSLARRPWELTALVLLIVGGMWISDTHLYLDPAFAKSRPWRQLFAYLEAHIDPHDVLVYTFPDPAPEVYTAGRWPVTILPGSAPPQRQEVARRAAQLVDSYDRIWMLPQWSPLWDESGVVAGLLDETCERAAEPQVGSWTLVLYHTPRLYQREVRPLDAQVGADVHLLGYVVRDSDGRSVDRMEVAAGESVRVTLYWRTGSAIDENYVAFVHLLDATGWLRGQQDNQPRGGTYPTGSWLPGKWVVDPYRVSIAADAPPGEYAIEVGMYHPESGMRLDVAGLDVDPTERRVLLRGRVYVR